MKKNKQTATVLFSDCDSTKFISYPNYFQWFDRATQQLFFESGAAWVKVWKEFDLAGFPLVDVQATFVRPAREGDEIEIESWVEEWRDKTFVVKHVITVASDVVVVGHEIRTWAVADDSAAKGIKAAEIPAEFKSRFD